MGSIALNYQEIDDFSKVAFVVKEYEKKIKSVKKA